MVKRLEKIIKLEEDSVRIYGLCSSCEKAVKVMGQGVVTKDDKYFIL
jgi:CRISPR-associated endonuclease Cas2